METNNTKSNTMVRRRALQVIGVGLSTASGLFVLGGCNKGGGQGAGAGAQGGAAAPEAKSQSCQDRVPVDEIAANLRKTMQYKEKSDTPAKKCNICAQYEAGKYGDCGGCKMFAGGVHPEGVCLAFAPLQAAPGAAPAAPAAPAGKAG